MASDPPRPTPAGTSASDDGAQALADFEACCELAYSWVASVPDDRWGDATPCDDWNMRALVNHMVGSARMVAYGVSGRPIGPDFYGSHLGPDPAGSYREAIDHAVGTYRADSAALARTISMPWGDLTGAELAVMFGADHLIHAWDVAATLGTSVQVDDALVERIRRFGDDYVTAHRGPGMFGDEVQPNVGASALDRLASFVGRRRPPRTASAPDSL